MSTETTILPRMRKEGMWPKPPALKKKCSFSPAASAARQRHARVSFEAAISCRSGTLVNVTLQNVTISMVRENTSQRCFDRARGTRGSVQQFIPRHLLQVLQHACDVDQVHYVACDIAHAGAPSVCVLRERSVSHRHPLSRRTSSTVPTLTPRDSREPESCVAEL